MSSGLVTMEYLGMDEYGVPGMGVHGVPGMCEHGITEIGEHGVLGRQRVL